MEVHYYDAFGNELSSPLPNPFVTSTQTISIQVINPENTNCIANSSINFIVNPLPDFDVVTPKTLCLTEPASTITLEASQHNSVEILDYEWCNSNNDILSTNTTLNVNVAGEYFLTLTKTDGTSCSRTKQISVIKSEIASVNMDDITIKDDCDNNSITINNTTYLGDGDYEFSLDNEYFGYLDEPFFEYVTPGIHTLYIKDKNNCGIFNIDLSVIGYPKFFTPNNDGYNDYWNVIGVNEKFYPNSLIYIFDRFGKLITKINTSSKGWDGTFKGELLTSSDYWFKVELIDDKGISKIRKGHFSLIRR